MAAQASKLTLISGSGYSFVKQEGVLLLRACVLCCFQWTPFVFTFCNKHIVAWSLGIIIYYVCCVSIEVVLQWVASLSTKGALVLIAP
jgi:hypothetical protein